MIVSSNTYIIVLIAIALLICAKPLYARFVKKQGNKYDAMYLLILILLPVNWYTPKITTVTDCGSFQDEVVLFPANKNGVAIGYGKNTYIFNNSDKKLLFEYLYYGNVSADTDEVNQIIEPGKSVKVNTISINYIFEEPDASVSSKSNGVTQTWLYCE